MSFSTMPSELLEKCFSLIGWKETYARASVCTAWKESALKVASLDLWNELFNNIENRAKNFLALLPEGETLESCCTAYKNFKNLKIGSLSLTDAKIKFEQLSGEIIKKESTKVDGFGNFGQSNQPPTEKTRYLVNNEFLHCFWPIAGLFQCFPNQIFKMVLDRKGCLFTKESTQQIICIKGELYDISIGQTILGTGELIAYFHGGPANEERVTKCAPSKFYIPQLDAKAPPPVTTEKN